MRLFIAIEPPEAWRRTAAEAAAALDEAHPGLLRLVRPELLHLTLRFLGEVDGERLEPLQAALREAVPPVEIALELGAPGMFGGSRGGAIWLGVGGDVEGLRALAARVETAVAAAGLPEQRRELRAHLTIARVRRQARGGERRAIAASVRALAAPEPAPFVARELVLVRSWLRPEGPRYRALARF
ncbi:MAG: RNA 2',3'-cyclic phosphodiesterase [Chloroflexi bacterium]|nr:RNA 2',3'-cyclic phosphodiesterase [Chloroflexota bacterium]